LSAPPWVDGPVRQKRQRDESRDQQPHAGIDVVPTQLLDEAMQRLLVGEHRRGDHAETNGKRLVAEHHQSRNTTIAAI